MHQQYSGLRQWGWLLACACLLLPVVSWAAALEAVAVGVTGKAEWRANDKGTWADLAVKQKLAQENVIRTGQGGEVTLSVGDNRAVVTIHELSEVQLTTLQQEEKKTQIGILLMAGRLWNKLKKAATGETEASLTIQTPAAVASVRGTSFFVESNATTKDARVGVWEGAVGVARADGTEEEKRVPAGFEIIVLFNKPLQDPKKMEAEDLKQEQRFKDQMDTLGVAAILGTPAAQGNEELVGTAQKGIVAANTQQKGAPIVRQDFTKLYEAITHLVADTGYVPEGTDTTKGKLPLVCLLENKDLKGAAIPQWHGPYIKSDFKDPFGGEYTAYRQTVNKRDYLTLVSLGVDHKGGNNLIEKVFAITQLRQDADKYKAAHPPAPAPPAEPAPAAPAAPAPTAPTPAPAPAP